MERALGEAQAAGVSHVIFGDLILADVRAYREAKMAGSATIDSRLNGKSVLPAWCFG